MKYCPKNFFGAAEIVSNTIHFQQLIKINKLKVIHIVVLVPIDRYSQCLISQENVNLFSSLSSSCFSKICYNIIFHNYIMHLKLSLSLV